MNVDNNLPINDQPEMCKSCRTFFGSQAFDGLCSKCFNQTKNKKKQNSQEQIKPKDTQKVLIKQEVIKEKEEEQKKKQRPVQANKTRCYQCRKKLGLLGIQCRCGYIFCNAHRLPEDHKCDFDHLQAGQQKLKKNIVKVQKGKIEEV